MKKTFVILVLSFLFTININGTRGIEIPGTVIDLPDYCSEPLYNDSSFDYSVCVASYDPEITSLADNSEYTRIEMIEGIWYGVINVTEVEVKSAYAGLDNYFNSISVSFTRDLVDLKQIELDIVTEDNSCVGVLAFNRICLGSRADSYEDSIIINSTSNEDNWLSFIDGDYIHENDKYDYIMFHAGPEIATVTVIKFTYILTEEEITNLQLDIQEQFENEKTIILSNPLLNDEDKLTSYLTLIEEYQEYQIDFGEELTSICIGDQCTAVNENTTGDIPGLPSPDWFDSLINSVLKGVAIILGALTGTVVISAIVYIIVKNILIATGNATVTGIKATAISSSWWGKTIATGILTTFGVVITGIKTMPKWAIITLIGLFLLLIIVLFL